MSNDIMLRSDDDIPVVINRIDAMLAQAKDIPDLNRLEAIAAAMRELGKKAGISLISKNTLTERYIDIRARRGEMLKRMKAEGRLDIGGGDVRSDHRSLAATSVSLTDLGITKSDSSRDQMLAELSKEEREELRATCERHEKHAKEFAMSMCLAKVSKDRKEALRAELARTGKSVPASDRWHIHHADMTTWTASRQYDFIITDPPYPKEYLPLWESLAERAGEWLKDGGLLIAMSGQSYLDEIYAMLSKRLDYYWTAAYLTPGQPTPLRQVNVNSTWKPLLIYSKGKYTGKIFGDVFRSDGNDKDNHKWGQSESGMYDIVSKMCLPGQAILDPFCGAGTTGVAAIRHGCLFDGVEVEEESVNITKARLA